MAESFLTRWERVIKAIPLNGHVIPPEQPWEREAASIICGHDFIQRMPEGQQAEFETFVREVIRTIQPRS